MYLTQLHTAIIKIILIISSYQIRLNELSKNDVKLLWLLDLIHVQLTGFDIMASRKQPLKPKTS